MILSRSINPLSILYFLIDITTIKSSLSFINLRYIKLCLSNIFILKFNYKTIKNKIFLMRVLPPAERVLHFCESKNWFNSRHASKTKENYLKTEKELFDDAIVTETFHLIDRDHSSK